MGNGKVFLTGAFGNVGANAVKHLSDQGYEIVCFDVRSRTNETKARELARRHHFTTVWGNLVDQDSVFKAMAEHKPDAILHLASVIAPMAYVLPELAHDVNVNGTRYLIQAAQKLKRRPKFINISSYTVHGPRNPYKKLPLITGDTPVNPTDNYGKQKVIAEQLVAASGLEWTTIRLPAVQATDSNWGRHPAFMKYAFLLSLDRHMHVLDSRDAALGVVNAIGASGVNGRYFDLGGPEDSCRLVYQDYLIGLSEARGIRLFPKDAFRRADPKVDATWYNEDFIDTSESQAILKYQVHSFQDYLAFVSEANKWTKRLLKVIGPLVDRQLLKESTTLGSPIEINSRPLWDVVCDRYNIVEEFRGNVAGIG
ncbi:MAG: NAD-dependent epimerase/dehydratase family protein, partial [Anaerolineae bacterium]